MKNSRGDGLMEGASACGTYSPEFGSRNIQMFFHLGYKGKESEGANHGKIMMLCI